MIVSAGERIPDDEGAERDAHVDTFFSSISEAFERIHTVAPLREVVYLNARTTGSDAWEQWTVEQQPQPTPCVTLDAFGIMWK